MDKKSITKWQDTFGTEPVQAKPDIKKVEQAWENMGSAFGKIQLEKLKYQKAGMVEVVNQINEKWNTETKQLEEKTLDLMGYPRLSDSIQSELIKLATSDDLHLNVYKLNEYKKIPPANISQAVMEAKQYFDDIEIWAIEEEAYIRPIKDPAVIGYKKIGYSRVPFLIATWGDDITPEDLGINVIKEIESTSQPTEEHEK